jgi:hypothetical protein
MNENTFKSGMAMMSKLFGKSLEDEIIPAYWNILKKISDEEFLKIQGNLIQTFIPTSQCPFPLPAHFLNAGGLSGQNRTKSAVNAILNAANNPGPYKTVSFGDLALHAVIERFGGWPIVASWTLDDWQFKEKQFLSAYEAALSSGEQGPLKLMGHYEFENADKVFDGKYLVFAEKMKQPLMIGWVGFDRKIGQLLEDKTKKDKLQIESSKNEIDNLTKEIGKPF